jgi:hypothetical protein
MDVLEPSSLRRHWRANSLIIVFMNASAFVQALSMARGRAHRHDGVTTRRHADGSARRSLFMRKCTMKTVHAAVTTFVLISAAAWPLTVDARGGDEQGQRTLEGTWLVQVVPLTDCQARTPLASFTALLTFAHDGTMTGTTTNPSFAIGQRSPDHGVWSRANEHTYRASSLALLHFTTAPSLPATPGFQAGGQRLDQTITVTDDTRFTSDAVVQFFDTAGRKYRDGCATATGRRFE